MLRSEQKRSHGCIPYLLTYLPADLFRTTVRVEKNANVRNSISRLTIETSCQMIGLSDVDVDTISLRPHPEHLAWFWLEPPAGLELSHVIPTHLARAQCNKIRLMVIPYQSLLLINLNLFYETAGVLFCQCLAVSFLYPCCLYAKYSR